ncbi:UDP-N-acetylmuramyl-tripeptide synthetase [Ligilactobacillus equi]|uniref:UDP-N-acetylmuramyl-tripeptide synthetase n=1 Tax=Ligilactobacillus equi DSM 15833 = JCM 10991 TaxID=1423740 RepID=A0A0R1THN3_9LACO|nr:UDP-N-acetylmuramyl-tripeptide synthetase [Ligilactobacillus equi]KRL80815.1 UDP-N-acetylmuramoyl-L-alanyl-D-glutamate--L-lysine ligase [Ligilactobacillus equi DSM 15833 = JCM 10991]
MELVRVIELLKAENLLKDIIYQDRYYYDLPANLTHIEFSDITYDSRTVKPESLFICKGINFNPNYLTSALEKGCQIFIARNLYENTEYGQAVAIMVKDETKAMAVLAREFYGNPQKNLKIIAFTGTKGKTTSAYFAHQLLNTVAPGKVGQFSTIANMLDGHTYQQAHLTTPESLDLFKMMRQMVDNGLEYLVMEVSSQAYKKNRVYGLEFDTAVFLNISHDHISPIEHPTFEDYLYCKSQIVEHAKHVIVNRQTQVYDYLVQKAQGQIVTFGTESADYHYVAQDNGYFDITTEKAKLVALNGQLRIRIPGFFNYENALAATLACLSIVDIDFVTIQEALLKTLVPGRMELAHNHKGVTACVDYAHNYLSITEACKFLKHDYPGNLIVVVGAPGGKAQSRRADIGQAVTEYADVVYLTSDDNFLENPRDIIAEIRAHVDEKQVETHVIIDRQEAIEAAIKEAQSGDVVFLAAKGREKFLHEGGTDIPYPGDHILAQKFLAKYDK